jgi:hypothetical protein
MTTWNRRSFLKTLGTSAMALSLGNLFPRRASAFTASNAKRVIFYYFPDGTPTPMGGTSQWHLSNLSTLSTNLAPLQPFVNQCIFLNGLTMGPTDAGSHPGGTKKLLTAVDGGHGVSIDRQLAATVGQDTPFKHVYLGAMATYNNAAADKFISYPTDGTTVAPIDDPAQAFQMLFGSAGGGGGSTAPDKSVLDTDIADINDVMSSLGTVEQSKLNLHLQALRNLETQLSTTTTGCGSTAPASIAAATSGGVAVDGNFPNTLQAQMDVMVNAMACGLTRVGVIQASQHTSELIMSRFGPPYTTATPMYTPNFDTRSHQASHYGDNTTANWTAYVQQVTWFVQQLAYLLQQLKNRPEGDGTMLDYSMVFICTEINDGNSHTHDNMPMVLCGGGGGRLHTGQLLDFSAAPRRHADLYVAMANAMGSNISTFGDVCGGVLPGVLV